MTKDLSEFEWCEEPEIYGLELACRILDAIETGSTIRSPFFHMSTCFQKARWWKTKAAAERGERDTLLCRVKVSDLEKTADRQGKVTLTGGLVPGDILRAYNQKEVRAWLNPFANHDDVQSRLACLRKAEGSREVIVAWRGLLPKTSSKW